MQVSEQPRHSPFLAVRVGGLETRADWGIRVLRVGIPWDDQHPRSCPKKVFKLNPGLSRSRSPSLPPSLPPSLFAAQTQEQHDRYNIFLVLCIQYVVFNPAPQPQQQPYTSCGRSAGAMDESPSATLPHPPIIPLLALPHFLLKIPGNFSLYQEEASCLHLHCHFPPPQNIEIIFWMFRNKIIRDLTFH